MPRTALDIARQALVEDNGFVRKPSIPLARLSAKDREAYLKTRYGLSHGKGKKKKKKK